MRIKDYFNFSFLLFVREKKKIFFSIIMTLCCIICIGILMFNYNIQTMIDRALSNVIGFRTICVSQREDLEDMQTNQLNEDIADIINIEHVIDVYESNYRETIIEKSDFASGSLDGTITFLRGTNKTLPTIVAGRGFEEGETGVAICPVSFYPTADATLVDREHLIDGRTLLNKTFKVSYTDFVRDDDTQELVENETYTKEFKIIGLYDVSERFNSNGTCYIPVQDMNEIISTKNSWEKEDDNSMIKILNGIDVVVDSVYNVNDVIKHLELQDFEVTGFGAVMDMNYINSIRIMIIIVLFIILFTIITIVNSYCKKMIDSEGKNIGVLKLCGYSKKKICSIYALKGVINYALLFTVGSVLSAIIFDFVKNNIPYLEGADLVMGGIEWYFYPYLFAFFVTVIIPTIFNIYYILKKTKLNTVELIRRVD